MIHTWSLNMLLKVAEEGYLNPPDSQERSAGVCTSILVHARVFFHADWAVFKIGFAHRGGMSSGV